MTDSPEGPIFNETEPKSLSMRDVLIRASQHENRAIPDSLRSIDISYLFPHIVNLRSLTSSHKREYGTYAGLTRYGQLHIDEPPTPGKHSSVDPSLSDRLLEEGVVALNIHTHPPDHDAPHSVRDISHLLRHNGVIVGEMVITDSLNTLIMRGPHTPLWNSEDEDKNFKELMQRARKAQTGNDYRGWNPYRIFVEANKATTSRSRYEQANAYAGFLREVVHANDLKWFSGSPGSKVLTLQSA